jgi:uncharacterized phage-associated protein
MSERGGIMANVNAVAKFFIDFANQKQDDNMTNLRLNKLLYFAQGHYLAKTGKPLFNNIIEAWEYGPVVPTVYRQYKTHGKNPIAEAAGITGTESLTAEEKEFLLDIGREYMRYSSYGLVDMTHKPDTPWSKVRYSGNGDGDKVIMRELIKEYFELPENKLTTFEDILSGLDYKKDFEFTGYIGEDGFLVLPKEEYEDWPEYD